MRDARRYDDEMNEGGEGYNPYRAKMDDREDARRAAKATQPKTRREQIEELEYRLRTECGSVAREWDSPKIDRLEAELRAEIQRLKAEEAAATETAYKAEWSREVTIERREEWNAFVRRTCGGRGRPTSRDEVKEICARINEQGWTPDDLGRAIKRHNLPKK